MNVATDIITGKVSFTDYIGVGESKTYTVKPTEDGVWTFMSFADGDTYAYLYDSEGNTIYWDDDGGVGTNFKIIYELKAGETYTLKVKWYNSDREGDVPILFHFTPSEKDSNINNMV